jgi:hypothetical protein
MEPVFFKAPAFDEVANYPLRCREAFLEQTARLSMASPGLRAYFVLPKINQILDDYLLWCEIYDTEQ